MNKNELTSHVARVTGYSVRDVTNIVNAVFETMSESLIRGATVSIQGFGRFLFKDCKPRRARNFATGEFYTMPAYTDVKFEVADVIYDAINPKKK